MMFASGSPTVMAHREADGQLGSGSGCCPRCVEMESLAESFRTTEGALRGELSRAEELRLVGHAAVSDMRLAVTASDQEAFMLAAQGVAASVTALNVIDPSAVIASAGAVTVNSANDVSLEEGTADLRAEAERLEEGRDAVAVPTFVPTSVGEATRAQMFKASAHAWIAAGAIDVPPLLFLLLVLCTSREPLLRDAAPLRRAASFEDRADRIVIQERQIAQASKLRIVAGE